MDQHRKNMSTSTIFIAVQCCQCSTMQVKQQKKSSNKWTCVVCNQKQSVRKIFARASMAKDVRKFVQSFNMSRKLSDEQESLKLTLDADDEQQFPIDQKKRRTDWTEYLDLEDYQLEENNRDDEGDEFEAKIVTELPKEMFKKPKLKNLPPGGSSDYGGGNELHRPVFSGRKINKHVISQDKEARKSQPAVAMGSSKWGDYLTEDDEKVPRPSKQLTAKRTSKWNYYMTQDDNDNDNFNEDEVDGIGTNSAHHEGQWSSDVLGIITNDERVEDDIHPDFM